MAGTDYNDEPDDLARSIAKRAERNPAFPNMVDAALRERQEQRRAEENVERTSAGSVQTARSYRRNLTAIGMHTIERDYRARYQRNGTQRKRGS